MRAYIRLALFLGLLPWTPIAAADPLVDAVQAVNAGQHRQAVQLLTPLADSGNAQAQYRLGLLYYHGQGVAEDERLAIAFWKKAAAQGNTDAMFQLGSAFLLGTQTAKLVADPDREAAKWFFQAGSAGHAEAQYMLGHLFLSGKGVVESRPEAIKWFRKASTQGHQEARRAIESVESKR